MALLYYGSIYNPAKAKALYWAMNENLEVFGEYLNIALSAQKKRKVFTEWECVEQKKEYEIKMTGKCIRVEQEAVIEFRFDKNIYMYSQYVEEGVRNFPIILQGSIPKIITPISSREFDGRIFVELSEAIQDDSTVMWGASSGCLRKNFPILSVKQSGNDLFLSQYEQDKDLVKIYINGTVSAQVPIFVNHIEITEWNCSASDIKAITDQAGNNYKFRKLIDKYYIEQDIPKNTTLLFDGIIKKYSEERIEPTGILYDGIFYPIRCEGNVIVFENPSVDFDDIEAEDPQGIHYKVITKTEKKERNALWIQLQDEEEGGENSNEKSRLDYFFEENDTIVEDNPQIYRDFSKRKMFEVIRKDRDEQKLLLKPKFYVKKFEYSDIPKQLFLQINTYQLERQQEAIKSIQNKPLIEHQSILSLTERKDQFNSPWSNFQEELIERWYVLTDESRKGTISQRKFVQKAITTPDFMLLEGPPGSGKTTAIMELIIQLIKRRKRILLSASTHVAIDNVIERLKEKGLLGEILPLRIGSESSFADAAKEYHIDAIAGENNAMRMLIIDSSNLVCGTTIGILKHPKFQGQYDKDSPVIPEFDYLIIDESSKTTFQEFLVPALRAKRWILVGDIKQLSPFTEPTYIKASLESIKGFTKEEQRANLLLFTYCYEFNNPRKNLGKKYCIIEKASIVNAIRIEYELRLQAEEKELSDKLGQVVFLQRDKSGEDNIIALEELIKGNPKSWILPAMDVAFVCEEDIEFFSRYIPNNMIILDQTKHIELYQNFFRSDAFYFFSKKIEREDYYKILDTYEEITREKSWATEIMWRMIRQHEVRFSKDEKAYFEVDIKRLLPVKNRSEVMNSFETTKDIALPSILECLKNGVGKRYLTKLNTVLNSGFEEKNLRCRYECLDYQHRMHPDISKYPREQFYSDGNNGALLDAPSIERDWDYNRYSRRSVWLNVNGRTERNYNKDEVRVMMEELNAFLSWAKDHPRCSYEKDSSDNWIVACLPFYKGQEARIRAELQRIPGCEHKISQFNSNGIKIVLYTVDRFQGREADVVFLTMVQTNKIGYLDSPNRLNVALTRARYQNVILGYRKNFLKKSVPDELRNLASNITVIGEARE